MFKNMQYAGIVVLSKFSEVDKYFKFLTDFK